MGIRSRQVLLVCAVLVLLCGAEAPRAAAEDPSQFVTAFLNEAFGLFRAQGLSEMQRRAALGELLAAKMDIPEMARYMTMDRVSTASPEAQQRFEGLLVGYLVDTFYSRIARGAAAPFDVFWPADAADPGDLAVDSVIRKTGSPPEAITWYLSPAGDSYKVVDVVSEGISLAITHRAVFGAVMLTGGLPRLEELLAARQ